MRDERDEADALEEAPDAELSADGTSDGSGASGASGAPGAETSDAETSHEAAPGGASAADPVTGLQPVGDQQSPAQHPATQERSVTGLQPTTSVPTGTAPRAVLRPVPDGFPTPPPRPARPNRAPALPAADAPPPPRRTPMYILLAVLGVLILVVGIGGGLLVFRALSGDPQQPAAGPPATSQAPSDEPDATGSGTTSGTSAGGGSVVLGETAVTLVSAEQATEIAPDGESPLRGEFLIVTLDIENGGDQALRLEDRVTLVTSQGAELAPDQTASRRHTESGVESRHENYVQPRSQSLVHLVFEGGGSTDGAELHFALDSDEGQGVLPLS